MSTTTTAKTTARPRIHMIDTEADALTNLAISVKERLPQVSRMLLDEIGRATVQTAARIADDVVTMHATVEFTDTANGTSRTVQLVYPKDADIEAGRISILTPIGAGLIGLRTGQSILWPDRNGRTRTLIIERVRRA